MIHFGQTSAIFYVEISTFSTEPSCLVRCFWFTSRAKKYVGIVGVTLSIIAAIAVCPT